VRIAIEIPMELPTPNSRSHGMGRARRVKDQRRTVRDGLDAMAVRVPTPCTVTLLRVSRGTADTDRAAISMDAVRDEVARWLMRIPFEVWNKAKGKMTTPRAPDGPKDPITWRYGQRKTKKVGYQAAHIIIEGPTS
jgi:hypothetical protein